jgi:hypothetical protein
MSSVRARLGILAALPFSLLLVDCGKTKVDPGPITWFHRMAPACAAAAKQDKPVLVFFAASWDLVTKELEHAVFPDADVRFVVQRDFIPLYIDRSSFYMNESADLDDDAREAEAAGKRWDAWHSKHGGFLVLARDCQVEVDRLGLMKADLFAGRLRWSKRAADAIPRHRD